MTGNVAISAIMRGVREFNSVTNEIQRNVDKATIGAVRENQRILKLAIRKNLNGAPRSNWRGKMWNGRQIYSQSIYRPDQPASNPRSGGPGKFTGALRNGVGSARPRVNIAGNVVGGVGVGGKLNNLKKHHLEAEFPYFAPAVIETEPKMAEAYLKGWNKAVNRMGGIL